MKKTVVLVLLFLIITVLSACSKKNRVSEAARPVEAFYQAIVSQERERVGTIACANWEKEALREVDAFMGVKSELKNFSCRVSEENKDSASVICSGAIAASYGAEITDFPLENRIHKVIKEQGEWRICGF